MRVLSPLNKDKSALSNIVAYVLLISITISLSVLVYGWLRFYVSEEDVETCSDNVNLIIRSYECVEPDAEGVGGRIKVVLKNKGLFTVDGYELRVHDTEDANFGFYLFDDEGVSIAPGDEYNETYYFDENIQADNYQLDTVTLLEIQPFVNEGGKVRCKSYASQEIECN